MSKTRACPVCGRPGLPPNCASCPQCDADLTCFQALDSLASSPAAAQNAAPPKRRFLWTALAAVALLLLAGLAVSMKSRLSELDRQLAELKTAELRAAAENKPEPPASAPETAAEQVPLPPESKIQIDARVRIVDEREAAQAKEKSSKQPAPAGQKVIAEAEEKTAARQAVKTAAGRQEKAADETPKVVSEVIRQPEEDDEKLVGSILPPLPAGAAEVPAAESAAAAVQAKTAEDAEQLAVLPDTPPVLLKPGFRKHRVRPAVSEAVASPRPADEPTQPAAAPEPPRSGAFSYLVKDGETAWDIAERFYGDRKYYPVLMEQNPHIFLGFIRKNSTVRLFADRREAAALYQRKIEQREGLLLWSHEVKPGETWRSIYARFFLPRYSGMIFYGDQDVAPGKTVRIILR